MHDNGEFLSDPHHVRSRGAGGSDIDNVIPLCRRHHQMFHQEGLPRMEDKYGTKFNSLARAFGRKWRTKKARERTE